MADAKEFAQQLILRLRAIDAKRAKDAKRIEGHREGKENMEG